jgi:hypothetical protein
MLRGYTMKLKIRKWAWWSKGECVVEILSTGHYPNTAMVLTPLDLKIEVEIDELQFNVS